MVIIGFSGHALVVMDIIEKMGLAVEGYCDTSPKDFNPFNLPYLGYEYDPQVANLLIDRAFFIAIGNNKIREKVADNLKLYEKFQTSLVHPSSIVGNGVMISDEGVMVGAGAIVNPFSTIKAGAILNTSSVVEHECVVGRYAHIGPGAVLCGNVSVGQKSFVGANAVIKENVTIGNNVTVGAGTVVLKDIPDGACVVGNPGKIIKMNN